MMYQRNRMTIRLAVACILCFLVGCRNHEKDFDATLPLTSRDHIDIWGDVDSSACAEQERIGTLGKSDVIVGAGSVAEQIRQKHNARIQRIPSIWAFVDFTAVEKESFTSGEGYLIAKPLLGRINLIWTILGEHVMYFGCNDEVYWAVFMKGDASIAYIARNENAYSMQLKTMPEIIHPQHLMPLIGLASIPDSATFRIEDSTVHDDEKIIWSYTQADNRFNTDVVFPIDRTTPESVVIRSRSGHTTLRSILTNYIEIESGSNMKGETIASKMVMTAPLLDYQLRVMVHQVLSRPRNRDAIDPNVFDINALLEGLPGLEVVIVDANCAVPAAVR